MPESRAFPAHARRALGDRLLSETVDLLSDLSASAYARQRSVRQRERLQSASERIALLRLLVRGAAERRYLSLGQREHASERLVELGRMIGGWLRHARKTDAPRR